MQTHGSPVVVWDSRARLWSGAAFATGGSPWGLIRLKPALQDFAQRLVQAGNSGLQPVGERDLRAARALVHRGLAHPQAQQRSHHWDVEVVVPAHDRVPELAACLQSLADARVLVIDDHSVDSEGITHATQEHGAQLFVRSKNGGPAASRNDGIARTNAEFIAFVDSDCTLTPGWLDSLMPIFDDSQVGAVAPRIRPRVVDESVTTRFEYAASALDMGSTAEVVRPGGSLSYLPAAVLIVRRSAIPSGGFDELMRLGEDVDFIWRMVESGWQVRYEPSIVAEHELRGDFIELLKRRYDYGTSVVDLDERHIGALVPARVSGWNLVAFAGVALKQPGITLSALGTATQVLHETLQREGAPGVLVPFFVGKTLRADALAIGSVLRREYWPIGWAALALSPTAKGSVGRLTRLAGAAMVLPLLDDWRKEKPKLDPARYVGLRLLADASYGTGVIKASVQRHSLRTLLPEVRFPIPKKKPQRKK
jgi:mycofactocin system glycosyltransferase